MKYYAAYGSNLNIQQMAIRCPGAKPLGTALLKDWQLLFKGSYTGSYLTIEKKKGSCVPLGIWQVDEFDEQKLDRYEGYPRFYQKFTCNVNVHLKNGKTSRKKVFIYAMPTTAQLGSPTAYYLDVCIKGYDDFGFDFKYLDEAYQASRR